MSPVWQQFEEAEHRSGPLYLPEHFGPHITKTHIANVLTQHLPHTIGAQRHGRQHIGQ